MAKSPTTRRGRASDSEPKLTDVARHVILPEGIVSTGWPPVRKRLEEMGTHFDRWQDDLGRCFLAKRADGSYASGIDGIDMSIPRQVGKTFIIGRTTFALCSLTPDLLALWTAHRTRTADETFREMKGIAALPKVAPYVDGVRAANGQQEIRFNNGSRILFGARESGFGRGFTKVSILVFDEAQILGMKALEDMIPATNAAANPLIFKIGTPPRPIDPGEAFGQARKEALAGERSDGMYVEFSADRNGDPDDRAQWRKANPSYPKRVNEAALLRMKRHLGPESFRREGLGIWDETGIGSRAISEVDWESASVREAPSDGVRSLAVAFSKDGERQAVAGALKHDDGFHVELVGAHSGPTDLTIASLADWLVERWQNISMIAICGKAASASLEQELLDRKVPRRMVHVMTTSEYFAACQWMIDGTEDGSVTHPAADAGDALEESVACTDKAFRGKDGSWGWAATTELGDETPLEAVSAALWAARTSKRVPGRKARAFS